VGLSGVLERIGAACHRVGRDPSEVTLVAVSKTFPAGRVREILDRGHDVFGENLVQEAIRKMDEVGPGPRWHLIGHLQRNKVRHVVGRFDLIHSLDGLALARELEKRAAAAGTVQPVLIQVNQAGEETKHGVPPARLPDLAAAVLELGHLELRGLMSIPPPVVEAEESRPWFAALRTDRDDLAGRLGVSLPDLSMGMTDDFEIAVEEGATLVRVGRAVFGERS
jgi:pyridoxal phosphate enzyme (YggS family)